ncbi:hypothetical protein NDI45_20515 [Leptolyngbya sp. GB1-A1]|uniref:hypothetical protein n=1 Tax=Leptolyngbya sp. GB1-A1 TaxID=2933908 RepID=UPI003296EE36
MDHSYDRHSHRVSRRNRQESVAKHLLAMRHEGEKLRGARTDSAIVSTACRAMQRLAVLRLPRADRTTPWSWNWHDPQAAGQ